MIFEERAQKVAGEIIMELTDRKEFRQVYDSCDEDIQKELKDVFAGLIEDAMREPFVVDRRV